LSHVYVVEYILQAASGVWLCLTELSCGSVPLFTSQHDSSLPDTVCHTSIADM